MRAGNVIGIGVFGRNGGEQVWKEIRGSEWIAGRGIVVMAAVSRRRVRDAGFRIRLPHLGRHSCGLSRAAYVHSVFVVTHLTRFDHAHYTFACWIQGVLRYWFEGVQVELTDARGGVTKYIILSSEHPAARSDRISEASRVYSSVALLCILTRLQQLTRAQ